jgi:Tfp pilus assembly protein PilO
MTIQSKDVVRFLKRYPVAIAGGALAVVMLAASYFRSDQVNALAQQSKEGEERAQKLQDDIRNGANLAEQYDTITALTTTLESRLVHGSERARNQQYFYRIESETGVKEISLQQTSTGVTAAKGSKSLYTGIGFAISVQGNYHQVLDFLGKIDSGQHFCRLISASVARAGQRGAANAAGTAALVTLTLNLELLGLP